MSISARTLRWRQIFKALIDLAVSNFGRLDCLFNNAGGRTGGTLETVTPEVFHKAMNLLLGSVVFGIKTRSTCDETQGGGSIINSSSVAAIRMNQGEYLYTAAKAAVTHITRWAGVELGPFGIRVKSISPGAIATPIFWGGSEVYNTLSAEQNARKMEKLKTKPGKSHAAAPGRSGQRYRLRGALLASDEGSFVNCHDLVVDWRQNVALPRRELKNKRISYI